MEKDDELKGEGNSYDFGARLYDPRLGKFLSIDQLAAELPKISPYSVAANSPIMNIDFNGLVPYTITIRAFAPFDDFGGGFHGDGKNRGFTTSRSATARTHQNINFDLEKYSFESIQFSSPTFHTQLPSYVSTEKPWGGIKSGPYYPFVENNPGDRSAVIGTQLSGSNPLTPGAPAIDVFGHFKITENLEKQMLTIQGSLSGNWFPAREAFITGNYSGT